MNIVHYLLVEMRRSWFSVCGLLQILWWLGWMKCLRRSDRGPQKPVSTASLSTQTERSGSSAHRHRPACEQSPAHRTVSHVTPQEFLWKNNFSLVWINAVFYRVQHTLKASWLWKYLSFKFIKFIIILLCVCIYIYI